MDPAQILNALQAAADDPLSLAPDYSDAEWAELTAALATFDTEFSTEDTTREFAQLSAELLAGALANPIVGVAQITGLIASKLWKLAKSGGDASSLIAVLDDRLLPQRWDRSTDPPTPIYHDPPPEEWPDPPETLTNRAISREVALAIRKGIGGLTNARRLAAHYAAGIAGAGEFAARKGLLGQTRTPAPPVARGTIWARARRDARGGTLPIGVNRSKFLAYLHDMLERAEEWTAADRTFGATVKLVQQAASSAPPAAASHSAEDQTEDTTAEDKAETSSLSSLALAALGIGGALGGAALAFLLA